MRVAFAGTPDFSVPCLEALYGAKDVELVAVYTQPDRPAGRGKKLQQSPVKTLALKHHTPVYQPTSFKTPEQQQLLESLDLELMVVTAYGMILPQAVLDMPRLGCINLHASLLPRWRGAAPIQRAIAAGDSHTGVALMQMEVGLDTGPVLASTSIPIEPNDTGGSLHDKLAILGGNLLRDHLDGIFHQGLQPIPQDEAQSCYAAKLKKSECPIDWSKSAKEIERRIRAFNPWPMSTAQINGLTLKIHHATPSADPSAEKYTPGTIINASRDGIIVATGSGCLNLKRIQKPGGKAMAVGDLLNGTDIQAGMSFSQGQG